MVKLVAALRARIPSLVDAFKHGHPVAGGREIENLMRLADTLARGETTSAPPRHAAATVVEQHLAPQEVSARLKRCMQRADEALHRSEMALQQARRLSALIEDPQMERPHNGVDLSCRVINPQTPVPSSPSPLAPWSRVCHGPSP